MAVQGDGLAGPEEASKRGPYGSPTRLESSVGGVHIADREMPPAHAASLHLAGHGLYAERDELAILQECHQAPSAPRMQAIQVVRESTAASRARTKADARAGRGDWQGIEAPGVHESDQHLSDHEPEAADGACNRHPNRTGHGADDPRRTALEHDKRDIHQSEDH